MYSHNDLIKVSHISLVSEIIVKCKGIRAEVGGQSAYNKLTCETNWICVNPKAEFMFSYIFK